MKILKIFGIVLKWLIVTILILFSIATFMGKSYSQTFILILIALTIAYWPEYFKNKYSTLTSLILRIAFIIVLLLIKSSIFKSDPKTSIYISDNKKNELMEVYDQKVAVWPKDTEDIYLNTKYGKVHLLTCGLEKNPPLVMIHAASMGAHSWYENLEPIIDHYKVYSIDNIGEGNKSQLNDVLIYPKSSQEIADLYLAIFDSLGIEHAPVFGASNGGYISMCLAYYYPERVEKLALFGPMGLTKLTGNSIMMLSLASMYPFQFIRDYVTKWAIGDDEYVISKYGDWFNTIMKNTIPSVAMPVPMKSEQKQEMDMPVLLFLGTKDAIVGDAEFAYQTAMEYPNIRIETLDSGHLIAVEQKDYVNKTIKEFLEL